MNRKLLLFLCLFWFLGPEVFAVTVEKTIIFTEDAELRSLCAEQGNCINMLSSATLSLGTDVAKIVDKIKEQSPSAFTYAEEGNIEKFKEDLKKQIDFCHRESILLRLKGDRDAEVTKKDRKKAESGVSDWVKDGAVNIFYWRWKSEAGKVEVIREEIEHQTRDIPIVNKYLSSQEIIEVADKIGRENLVDKDILSNKFKITKEAYKEFTDIIIDKVLKENCVTNLSKQEFAGITADFKSCIDDAVIQRNIDRCLSKFENSVGYRVGEKILDKMLIDNFAEFTPVGWSKQKWNSFLNQKGHKAFNRCADNWFFSEQRSDPEDITTCVYNGIAAAFQETIKIQIGQGIKETVGDPQRRQQIVDEVSNDYKCQYAELFKHPTSWSMSDWEQMKSVTSVSYKNGINECVRDITILAGKKATEFAIRDNKALQEQFENPEDLESFVNELVNKHYSECIGEQEIVLSKLNANYIEPKNSCSSTEQKKKVDPAKCEEWITAEATISLVEEGIDDSIDDLESEFLPENWPEARNNIRRGVKPILQDCRQHAQQTIKTNLHHSFQQNLKKDWEKSYLQCSSGAISLIAYEAALPTLESELRKNKATKGMNIKLSAQEIDRFKKKISRCYSDRVSALSSVVELGSKMEGINKECALEGKKDVMPAVLTVVLDQTLLEHYPNKKKRKKMINLIMRSPSHKTSFSWRNVFATARTDKDVDEYTNRFQAKATRIVFEDLLKNNLNSFFPLNGENSERNEEIHRRLLKKYAGDTFEQRLIKSPAQSEKILDTNQLAVTREIVDLVLTDNIENNLKDEHVQKRLRKMLMGDFDYCIEKNKNKLKSTTKVIDTCTEELKISAYYEIGFRAMRDKIYENVPQPHYANKVIGELKTRLRKCLDKAHGKRGEAFNHHVDGCVNDSAILITRDISRYVTYTYGPVIGTKYSSKQLKKFLLLSRRRVTEEDIKRLKIDRKDPAVVAHMTMTKCVDRLQRKILSQAQEKRKLASLDRNSIEYAMTKSNITIGHVTDELDRCAKKYEGKIVAGLKKRFVEYKYPGKKKSHLKSLGKAFDLMMLLKGESDAEDNSTPEDTWKQLALVGESTVIACNYSQKKCDRYLKYTKYHMERFRKIHPHATNKELLDEFYTTSYMKFIVRASIAKQIKEELLVGVGDYLDKEGILKQIIDRITDAKMMEPIFKSGAGYKVVRRALELLKQGKTDDIGSDPEVRKQLSIALTKEHPEFVANLLYGIVEPKLRAEKRHPSFKTGLGLLFGVVKKKNMDWAVVNSTPGGKKARDYFAKQILAPLFAGKEIPPKEYEKRSKKLEDLVIDAIKKAK